VWAFRLVAWSLGVEIGGHFSCLQGSQLENLRLSDINSGERDDFNNSVLPYLICFLETISTLNRLALPKHNTFFRQVGKHCWLYCIELLLKNYQAISTKRDCH
jgi:hypothetical protein